jgi:hypothetical protein
MNSDATEIYMTLSCLDRLVLWHSKLNAVVQIPPDKPSQIISLLVGSRYCGTIGDSNCFAASDCMSA